MEKNLNAVELFDGVLAEQAESISRIASLVAELYHADDTIESTSVKVADTLRDVLLSQGKLTLGWFDAVRLGFGDDYRKVKVGSSDEAVRKAWSRAFKCVTDLYSDIEKPKAETNGAEAKAAQRAKQAELLAAYEDTPVHELRTKAKELYNQAGDGDKEAKKQADLIIKAVDAKQKAEVKEAKDSLKTIKAEITALLKLVTDLEVLTDVRDMLEGSVDDADALL